nr:ABATE domain-containing protein [Bradyrhizobium sp. 199]
MRSIAHGPVPGPLHRIAGNLALDFANTISWRGTDHEVDHLRDADGILAWAKHAGLVGVDFSLPTRQRALLVDQGRSLRTAIDEVGAAIAAGAEPAAQGLAVIHDLAARTFMAASLTGAPARIAFTHADQIIGPLAWAAVDLLRGDELGRLKRCPQHDCHWLFIDRTKNRSRRWCEMATCGNRAKTRSRR